MSMKIALVHDQLQEFGGAERVLVVLMKAFPTADVFTCCFNPTKLGTHYQKFKNRKITTSWADKNFLTKKFYSPLRFLTPLIWESFDFSEYDLVISSSGSYMSHGVITNPNTLHICYLHHPPRYLYFYETAREWKKYAIVRAYAYLINKGLRIWDYISAQRVDYFIANSIETKRRIKKFYRRDATVIYPPVSIPKKSEISNRTGKYYLTVSRLARAKHIEILIKAALKEGFNLKIVGKGRDMKFLRKIAGKARNIEFLEEVSDKKLNNLYRDAKAFLFASVDEEFGIAPIEALGHGVPVIAYSSGGVPEYIKEGINGYLYRDLTPDSLIKKIKILEALKVKEKMKMRKEAYKTASFFSTDKFIVRIKKFIKEKYNEKRA